MLYLVLEAERKAAEEERLRLLREAEEKERQEKERLIKLLKDAEQEDAADIEAATKAGSILELDYKKIVSKAPEEEIYHSIKAMASNPNIIIISK